MRHRIKRAAVVGFVLAGLPLLSGLTAPASADGCIGVDSMGVCFYSATIGGPQTVGVPSETVTTPTTVCVYVTCIPKGTQVVTTPPESATVPLPYVTEPYNGGFIYWGPCQGAILGPTLDLIASIQNQTVTPGSALGDSEQAASGAEAFPSCPLS